MTTCNVKGLTRTDEPTKESSSGSSCSSQHCWFYGTKLYRSDSVSSTGSSDKVTAHLLSTQQQTDNVNDQVNTEGRLAATELHI